MKKILLPLVFCFSFSFVSLGGQCLDTTAQYLLEADFSNKMKTLTVSSLRDQRVLFDAQLSQDDSFFILQELPKATGHTLEIEVLNLVNDLQEFIVISQPGFKAGFIIQGIEFKDCF